MATRKVCVVITARPSYSRIKTALTAIKNHPDLEFQLVVAGSALLHDYGRVINFIEKDGFEIYIGSQSDPEFWRKTLKEIGDIDVLLDDGGHTFEQQIITVESALPAIKDGGLLVVEDTHTSYMKEFGGSCKYSFIEYAKNIVDGINYRFGEFSNRKYETVIYGVLFYESFVALEVNRKKSVVSSSTKNEGKEFGAEDFRYYEDKQLHLPKKINKLEKKIRNYIKILNLRKYFRYN